MKRWVLGFLVLFVGLCVGYMVARYTTPAVTTERIERDTITIREVAPQTITPSRIELKPLPRIVFATEYLRDTTYIHDTVTVAVPLSLYKFEESDFRAEIEGFGVTLRSMEVFPQTIYQTTTTSPRWGAGVQVGVTFSQNGIAPYLGIGIQYNIVSW